MSNSQLLQSAFPQLSITNNKQTKMILSLIITFPISFLLLLTNTFALNLDVLHFVLFEFVFVLFVPILLPFKNRSKIVIKELPSTSSSKDNYNNNNNTTNNQEIDLKKAVDFTKVNKSNYPINFVETDLDLLSINEQLDDYEDMTKNQTDFKIYKSINSTMTFKGETKMKHETEFILKQIIRIFDLKTYKRLDKIYLEESKILEQIDENNLIVYMKIKKSWISKARDIVIFVHTQEQIINQKNSTIIYIQSIQHELKPINNNIIRMNINKGILMFQNNNNIVSCDIKFFFEVDSNGWIPKSVIKYVINNIVYKLFVRINNKQRPLQSNIHLQNLPSNRNENINISTQTVNIVSSLNNNISPNTTTTPYYPSRFRLSGAFFSLFTKVLIGTSPLVLVTAVLAFFAKRKAK